MDGGIECVNIVTDDHNSTVMHLKRWKELSITYLLLKKQITTPVVCL